VSRGKLALVCAGGGVTGAVYEIGCLRALEDLLDRSVLDFDTYVGVSGGAFVTALLAAGISPREIYDEVTAEHALGLAELPLVRLGLRHLAQRGARAPRVLRRAVAALMGGERTSLTDAAAALFELLPAGLLDNSGVRDWLRRFYARRGVKDRFDALERDLHVVAVDLDDGEATAFSRRSRRQVPVSRAVQASTALPGLYRPVRIGGRDYVDGGVRKTAHINLAIQEGAELVVCINPLVPFRNTGRGPLRGRLSEKGVTWVLDQVLRIVLHARMQYGMERYAAEHPEVDIILIEPARDDMRMFSNHIMRLRARRALAEHGYRSALHSFRRQRARYARVLGRHGIRVADPRRLPPRPAGGRHGSNVTRSLARSLDSLRRSLRRA
jgi:predicted acylesterase/phospholipase RssA